MKTIIQTLMIMSFSTPVQFLLGTEPPSYEEDREQREKISSVIFSRDATIDLVKQEMAVLEKMYENHSDIRPSVVTYTINELFIDQQLNPDRWSKLIDELGEEILDQEFEDSLGKGQQIQNIINYVTLDAKDTPAFIEVHRKKRIAKLLELWQYVLESIDDDWDISDPANILPPYSPPITFTESFSSGQSPDDIIDPIVRQEYTEYLEKRDALFQKQSYQTYAKDIIDRHRDRVKEYIIYSYSLPPFAAGELESLLTEYKVEESFAKDILDEVKEAEKNPNPPINFGIWQAARMGIILEPADDIYEILPLLEGEVLNPDGSISRTTTTTVEIPMDEIYEQREEVPVTPAQFSPIRIVLIVIGVILMIVSIYLRIRRK